MAAAARAEKVVTAKDVIEFGELIKQYLRIFECPSTEFPDDFEVRFQELGQIIREEAEASGQKISWNTILGIRSRLAFRDLKLWAYGQGIRF